MNIQIIMESWTGWNHRLKPKPMKNIYFSSILLYAKVRDNRTNSGTHIRGQLKSNDDGLPPRQTSLKGTTRGTVTDADGRYSISVPIGSVLVFIHRHANPAKCWLPKQFTTGAR